MLWSVFMAAALGIILGLRFRAGALLAATAATAAAARLLLGGPVLPRVLVPVLSLQCAYVAGLALSGLWKRMVANGH